MNPYRIFPVKCPNCNKDFPIWKPIRKAYDLDDKECVIEYYCSSCNENIQVISPITMADSIIIESVQTKEEICNIHERELDNSQNDVNDSDVFNRQCEEAKDADNNQELCENNQEISNEGELLDSDTATIHDDFIIRKKTQSSIDSISQVEEKNEKEYSKHTENYLVEENDMFRTNLLSNTEVHNVVKEMGCYSLVEYEKDLSVSPMNATTAYFSSLMNVRKRQVVAKLNGNGVIIQAGSMEMMLGQVDVATNVNGAGDLLKKVVGSKVTGETAIKPRYTGNGMLVLEPTYKYIIFEDLDNWAGGIVIEDGMFLACDDSVKMKVSARTNISSALLGNEGMFNTALQGKGVVVLESPVPSEELVVVDLKDDVIKIDGSMAIAWSTGLQFTVEKTTKTIVGSAASGEGLVNVYRGTGRILIAPVRSNYGIATPEKVNKK